MITIGRRIEVRGIVQGVGFRPWIYKLAHEGGVTGRVRNDAGGVIIDVFGSESALDGFARDLIDAPPPAAEIADVHWHDIPPEPLDSFTIPAARRPRSRRISIPPDLATCSDCLAEIFDPTDRRYRYPVHQLHELRAALHDRTRRAVRPRRHDDGALHDVRRVPARV